MTSLLTGCNSEEESTQIENVLTTLPSVTSTPIRVPENIPSKVFVGRVQGTQGFEMALFTEGRIERVFVQEGQQVQKGDLLAQLYSPSLNTRVKMYQAALDSAKATYIEAVENQSRTEDLVKKKLQNQAQLDAANRNLNVAKQNVVQAEATLLEARNKQQDTKLIATQTGIIANLFLREGDFVEEGEPVLRFEVTQQKKVVFALPETESTQLNEGDKVRVKLPTVEQEYAGTIGERAIPSLGAPALFDVTVNLSQAENASLGLTAELHLPISDKKLYEIDVAALRYDERKRPYVLVDGDNIEKYSVSIASITRTGVLVESSLPLDSKVITTSEAKLALNLTELEAKRYE